MNQTRSELGIDAVAQREIHSSRECVLYVSIAAYDRAVCLPSKVKNEVVEEEADGKLWWPGLTEPVGTGPV